MVGSRVRFQLRLIGARNMDQNRRSFSALWFALLFGRGGEAEGGKMNTHEPRLSVYLSSAHRKIDGSAQKPKADLGQTWMAAASVF